MALTAISQATAQGAHVFDDDAHRWTAPQASVAAAVIPVEQLREAAQAWTDASQWAVWGATQATAFVQGHQTSRQPTPAGQSRWFNGSMSLKEWATDAACGLAALSGLSSGPTAVFKGNSMNAYAAIMNVSASAFEAGVAASDVSDDERLAGGLHAIVALGNVIAAGFRIRAFHAGRLPSLPPSTGYASLDGARALAWLQKTDQKFQAVMNPLRQQLVRTTDAAAQALQQGNIDRYVKLTDTVRALKQHIATESQSYLNNLFAQTLKSGTPVGSLGQSFHDASVKLRKLYDSSGKSATQAVNEVFEIVQGLQKHWGDMFEAMSKSR